jgi:hypothetical protein
MAKPVLLRPPFRVINKYPGRMSMPKLIAWRILSVTGFFMTKTTIFDIVRMMLRNQSGTVAAVG